MNRSQWIAAVSLGFACGMAWTVACGGTGLAVGDSGQAALPARAVVYIETLGPFENGIELKNVGGCAERLDNGGEKEDVDWTACCPDGFTPVGHAIPGESNQIACLEDAS